MEKQGRVVVDKVGGRSRVTRCFSKYPLKFIIPRKVSFLALFIFSLLAILAHISYHMDIWVPVF